MNISAPCVLVICILISCSSSTGTTETSKQDSVGVHDTARIEIHVTETKARQDTSQLNNQLTEKRDAVLNETAVYYHVSVTSRQYEAASDVTWYFDSTFSPRYVNYTWSAEGQDGMTELIIENGEVVCGQVEELNSTDRWCEATGGTRMVWNEETGEDIRLLSTDYGNELNVELAHFLNTLRDILKQGERSDQDEYTYTVRSEHTLDVGFEFTETIETTVPKELYEQLIR